MIYLVSSALMKLVGLEDETAALRDWLSERRSAANSAGLRYSGRRGGSAVGP
ncbi:MAG: hypothetical protein ACRDRW_16735 [Pseudonocardiaceae bacterium]